MIGERSSPSGAMINKFSCLAISRAISLYVVVISSSIGAQSVLACGHVSCTPHCGSHSAGKRQLRVSSFVPNNLNFGAKVQIN